MKYQIWLRIGHNKGLVKEYPFKLQAYAWCFLKGYVYNCGGSLILDHRITIKEVENEGL